MLNARRVVSSVASKATPAFILKSTRLASESKPCGPGLSSLEIQASYPSISGLSRACIECASWASDNSSAVGH